MRGNHLPARGLRRYWWVAVLAIAGWQLLAVAVDNDRLFPSLDHLVLKSLPEIALLGGYRTPAWWPGIVTIVVGTGVTLARVAVGLFLGTTAGVAASIAANEALGRRVGLREAISAVSGFPLFALIPLFLYWFSARELGMVLYIAFGVFVVVSVEVLNGLSRLPPEYRERAELMGAGGATTYGRVLLPAVLPTLRGSVRSVGGLVWAFSLGSEYLAGASGLGYLTYQSYLYGDMGKLLVLGAWYSGLALLSSQAADRAIQRMTFWRSSLEEVWL